MFILFSIVYVFIHGLYKFFLVSGALKYLLWMMWYSSSTFLSFVFEGIYTGIYGYPNFYMIYNWFWIVLYQGTLLTTSNLPFVFPSTISVLMEKNATPFNLLDRGSYIFHRTWDMNFYFVLPHISEVRRIK